MHVSVIMNILVPSYEKKTRSLSLRHSGAWQLNVGFTCQQQFKILVHGWSNFSIVQRNIKCHPKLLSTLTKNVNDLECSLVITLGKAMVRDLSWVLVSQAPPFFVWHSIWFNKFELSSKNEKKIQLQKFIRHR